MRGGGCGCGPRRVPSSEMERSPRAPAKARGSPGNDSSSDDDAPLSKLSMKRRGAGKQLRQKARGADPGRHPDSKMDNSASGDSSDDEPLIKKMARSAPAKKTKEKSSSTSNDTNGKKAASELNSGGSSDGDDEPLMKKAGAKPVSGSPDKPADPKKREAAGDDVSSDEEPLSEVAEKLKSRHKQKPAVTPPREAGGEVKSKRNAARKYVRYAESSSDGSDDGPHVTPARKRKKTKMGAKDRRPARGKKTKPKRRGKAAKDYSSDDNEPLVSLVAKRSSAKKNAAKMAAAASPDSAAARRPEQSDRSSDEEPSIDRTRKTQTDKGAEPKMKGSTPKKRDAASRQPRKKTTGTSSDDETSTEAARHPQVTKNLRILLVRCDGDADGARTPPEQEDSEESAEEEED